MAIPISVERSCWYLYGVKTFSLIKHLIPGEKPAPSFWPGDQVETDVLASDDYKQVSANRMSKLRNFLKCEEFDERIVKACVSSLPRWRYARELASDPKKKRIDPDYDEDSSDSDAEFVFVSGYRMRYYSVPHTFLCPDEA